MLMFYMGHVIWQMLIKTVEPERTGHFRSFELHRELIQTVLKAFNVFSGSLWPTILQYALIAAAVCAPD